MHGDVRQTQVENIDCNEALITKSWFDIYFNLFVRFRRRTKNIITFSLKLKNNRLGKYVICFSLLVCVCMCVCVCVRACVCVCNSFLKQCFFLEAFCAVSLCSRQTFKLHKLFVIHYCRVSFQHRHLFFEYFFL